MAARTHKTALVTGASGGIGKAIAECFARDGHDLVVTARNTAALAAIADDWQRRHGVVVTAISADLSQASGAQGLFEEVKAAGIVIDFLVNNAGYGLFGEFKDLQLEDELAMMTLNMTSLTVLSKCFLPQILARRGRIMNVASTAAFQPGPYMAVYYATKAYVLSLSEALASELARTGVTVTAFCPGPTQSGFQDKAAMQESGLVKGKRLPTAEAVGTAGYRAMMAGKRVFIPGLVNKALANSVRVSPRNVVTGIVKAMSAPKK
jgi:short-subunit dehydrogenase